MEVVEAMMTMMMTMSTIPRLRSDLDLSDADEEDDARIRS